LVRNDDRRSKRAGRPVCVRSRLRAVREQRDSAAGDRRMLDCSTTRARAFVQGASLDAAARDGACCGGIRARDGWRAVRDGRTTVAEVARVVSEDGGR
jgi:hypothetical protein